MAQSSEQPTAGVPQRISITPLLKRLAEPENLNAHIPAEDIALAWSRSFDDEISSTQLTALLTLLYVTGRDKHPDIIARCASAMRHAAVQIDIKALQKNLSSRPNRANGMYRGGLCDIVGTGGDHHSTFNISTTSSIVASPLLSMAKHGSKAQTSMSGSADVLMAIKPRAPRLAALTADCLPEAYASCNYTFLLATNFHPGMKYAATVRRELGLRTIFNLMGPLANPVEKLIEARVLGVAYQQLGPVFAEALQVYGTKKAMVICGQEDLDEISCAGPTNCWWIKEVPNPRYKADVDMTTSTTTRTTTSEPMEDADSESDSEPDEPKYIGQLETFTIQPSDFGLPTHPLSSVGGGKLPGENAKVLMQILRNELEPDHAILHFVLINVAALLVVSGICDGDTSPACVGGQVITERGPAGGRWKEGIRLARWCIESGQSAEELEKFIDFTHTRTHTDT